MAEELNVGKLVAEIVLEAKTEGAGEAIEAINEINDKASNAKPKIEVTGDTSEVERKVNNLVEKLYQTGKSLGTISVTADISAVSTEIDNIIKQLKSIGEISPEVDIDINSDRVQAVIAELHQNTNTDATIKVNTENDDALNSIRLSLEQIGIKGVEAEKILSTVFSDTSGLKKYQENIEIISNKIDLQRKKISELESIIQKEPRFKSDYKEIEEATKAIDKEKIALQELELRFDKAVEAQDNWVSRQVQSYQKQEAAATAAAEKQEQLNKKMSDKTSKANVTALTKTVTSSLKTVDNLIPDVMDNVDGLISGFTALKEAINNTDNASKAMVLASSVSAIASIVSAAVSIVVSFANQIEEKKKEKIEEIKKINDESQDTRESLSETTEKYIEVKTKLDTLNISRSEEIELNKELISLQGDLKEAYSKEIESIDLKNSDLETTLKTMREINKIEADKWLYDNEDNIENAEKKLNELAMLNGSMGIPNGNIFSGASYLISDMDFGRPIFDAFREAGFANLNGYFVPLNLTIEEEINALDSLEEKFKEKRNNYNKDTDGWNYFNDYINKIKEEKNKLDTEEIATSRKLLEERDHWLEISQNDGAITGDEANAYNALFKVINENISAFSALQDAYTQLSSGQALNMDSLVELSDKYPEIQKYIAETGDLSLQNGEYLKKVAQDTMKNNLDRIESEKAALESKGELTSEEKGYYEELEAKALIYQSQLKDLNSVDLSQVSGSLSSLGNAFSQLSQGKELDFDTTLSLISQYPQLAQAMANGNLSIENQAGVIKRLWEIKKSEAITSLELEKKKQQEVINTTNTTISELQKQITAYEKSLATKSSGGSEFVELLKKISKAKGEIANLENVVEKASDTTAIDAQIAAINGLTIETYNSTSATSGKNEALAEELKYMEHLKALGQLTAEEELAWLQRINASYSQNADERYDMEVRLYNAEKALREEQEKAIQDALQAEYKAISDNKSLDNLSKQEELDWLLRIRDQYALNAEQAMELQIKIYDAEKALRDEKLQNEYTAMNNQKSLDRLTSEQELEWLERIRATFELNAEQRIELEIKIHNIKKQLFDEEQTALEQAYDEALENIERRKKLANINFDLEIAYLDEIRRKYKLTAEDAADLEQRIRDLISDKKEADISALDKLGDAVTEALKNKYEQQREFEEERINESIENWKTWEDETVAAIQGQIDALDKLDEAQESEDKRREYELKRQQVEMELAYEKDDYNRKQLQKELNRLDKEEAKRLLEEERKAQKEALEAQIEEVKKQSEDKQQALQDELDALGENYDELTSAFNLKAEAQKVMMNSTQKEMIELIQSYAPEYDLAGQSIGDAVYHGFAGKYKSIETMVKQIGNFVSSYQYQLQRTANQAADDFWANRAEYEAEIAAKAAPEPKAVNQDIHLTVNFNEPVESPVQVRRQLETVVENLAAEIRK